MSLHLIVAALFLFQAVGSTPLLDNEFVQVFKNRAPCAAEPSCGDRVLVALGPVEVGNIKLRRGDIKVFPASQHYRAPDGGDYFEVNIKSTHPRVAAPSAQTPPAPHNKVLYDGKDFTVFEERMEPGEKSAVHSHNLRLAIFLNKTLVQQWTEGREETRELVPDAVMWRPAVVHASKDVGTVPIRNILIEFKPWPQ